MATQHYFLHGTLLFCALGLMSSVCGAFDRCPTEEGIRAANRAAIPRTPPSISGRITKVALPLVMVEENPAEAQGSAKANVRITKDARIINLSKPGMTSKDLKVGQSVKIWFAGPVMESYPVQASAAVIVIE